MLCFYHHVAFCFQITKSFSMPGCSNGLSTESIYMFITLFMPPPIQFCPYMLSQRVSQLVFLATQKHVFSQPLVTFEGAFSPPLVSHRRRHLVELVEVFGVCGITSSSKQGLYNEPAADSKTIAPIIDGSQIKLRPCCTTHK